MELRLTLLMSFPSFSHFHLTGNRITLARRYVADDRANWGAKKVKSEILEQIYDSEEESVVMPPWNCKAMNA